jgi:hypothetical protein
MGSRNRRLMCYKIPATILALRPASGAINPNSRLYCRLWRILPLDLSSFLLAEIHPWVAHQDANDASSVL